jgi:Notch-like protein
VPADTYNCTCTVGWEGHNCEENIDDCLSAPCQHSTTCADPDTGADDVNFYACNCSETLGWEGHNCADDIDECSSDPCQNGVVCNASLPSVALDTYNCTCTVGWEGYNCAADVDECSSDPCQHGAMCNASLPSVALDTYNCSCARGWEGKNCADDINECLINPCQHNINSISINSTCSETSFVVDVNETVGIPGCDSSFIHPHFGVSRLNGKEGCDAESAGLAFFEDLKIASGCIHINMSDSSNGTVIRLAASNLDDINMPAETGVPIMCPVLVGVYSCSCVDGVKGEHCADDIDECLSAPCQHDSACNDSTVDSSVSIDAYSCNCSVGWEGHNCADDVDECASSPCKNEGICDASLPDTAVDSYNCSCVTGSSGENCGEDLDECLSNPCHRHPTYNTTCTDSSSSSSTSVPLDAYLCNCTGGMAGHNCADDIDECLSAPCQHNSACNESTVDSSVSIDAYSCNCSVGWEGHNCADDIDECLSMPCSNSTQNFCRASMPVPLDTYNCSCADGWAGQNCAEDIDECASVPCLHDHACEDSTDKSATVDATCVNKELCAAV